MAESQQNPALPIEELQQRLLSEKQRMQQELVDLTSGDDAVSTTDALPEVGGLVTDRADDADALNDYERNRAIIEHTRQLLTEVDAALARIDAGTYGICTNCGRPIQLARLEALPYVALCIDCQTKSELTANQGG